MERIQKTLSRAGIASRRQAEQWLVAGRIRVNGQRVTQPGFKVSPGDQVEVDGRVVETSAPQRYLLLYKPRSCVTTRFDPEGRPTTADFLPREESGLFPVGRLDRETSGLLLLTNDGDTAHALLHPSLGNEREYKVSVKGQIDEKAFELIHRMIVQRREKSSQGGNIFFGDVHRR